MQHTRQGKLGVEEQRVVVTPTTFTRPAPPMSSEGGEVLRRFLDITRRER